MHLNWFDAGIIALYFLFSLGIGLALRKKATRSVADFFVSGRSVPWWLAGTSIVATTFAADTPLAVTGLVARNGIAGNWIWWSMAFSGMLTVFFYARLWRRAEVLTDVEFAEIRYSGRPARFLRGFRALYLGLPVNLIIMGWVNLAMVKILMLVLGVNKFQALLLTVGVMLLTALISTLSGLWGVLVTDLFQFGLIMILSVVLAVLAVGSQGGMAVLIENIRRVDASSGSSGSLLSFFPAVGSSWMPVITFVVYVAVNWWASWYPGAEPGGGGYVVQRVLSAKDEKHSLLATLWFNIAHYALRPWPWILVALAAVALFHGDPAFASDPESGYIRVLLAVLPSSLRGLMIAGFFAAYMSTLATQFNWGASYLVNDFYRRFLVRDRRERHYVRVSQATTMALMALSAVVTFYMDSIADAWKFLIALGAGTGLVYLLRWFWWRINAWSEVSAMAAAFVTSLALRFGFRLRESEPTDFAMSCLITMAVTTLVWLSVTLMTRPESKAILLSFYRRVRPDSALWGPIAREASDVRPNRDGLFNLLDWVCGVVMIYAFLFGVGKILFGQVLLGAAMLAGGLLAGAVIYADLNRRGWKTVVE